jgi:hypothetical protein
MRYLIMNKLYVVSLLLFLSNFCVAQSDIYNQEIQYNILIDSPQDSVIEVEYEVYTRADDGQEKRYITESIDSFMMVLQRDLVQQGETKNQVLFYIHGMWGGRSINFNKAYKLMSDVYLDSEKSDISRIISLKWPGNKMEYKDNKKTLYSISDSISDIVLNFLEEYHSIENGSENDSSIDLIAHSLGTELFKEVVVYASENDRVEKYFDQIVIAAPDWDVEVFSIDTSLYNISGMAERIQVYFSTRDMTLSISRNLNKQSRFGLDGPPDDIQLPDNVFAINVTNVKDDDNFPDLLSGHNYYRASPVVTQDILLSMMGHPNEANTNRKVSEKYRNVYYLNMSAVEKNK